MTMHFSLTQTNIFCPKNIHIYPPFTDFCIILPYIVLNVNIYKLKLLKKQNKYNIRSVFVHIT